MFSARKTLTVGAFLAMVLLAVGCPSGPSIQLDGWLYNTYSSNTGDVISQRPDGGYFVAGTAHFDGQILQYVCYSLGQSGQVESSFALPGLFSQARPGPGATALLGSDGNVYIAGLDRYSAGPDAYQGRLRVVKTSTPGTKLWDYTYGEEHWEPRAIVETTDGYIAVGVELSTVTWRPEMVLMLDADGNALWNSMIPDAHKQFFMDDGKATAGGGLVFAGYDDSTDPDAALWCVDRDGNTLWYKRYDRSGSHEAKSVALAPDGGFYLGGITTLSNLKRRPYLVKTDADGEFEWDRDDIYAPEGASADVQIWDMVVDDEGYIAMVGDEITVRYIGGTIPVTSGNSFIMRLDSAGNLVWKTDIGGLTYGIDYTQQGTYITTGVAAEYVRVLEFNKNGKLVN